MRVLVTRPQPGAARTSSRIAERGHLAIELPLTEIVAIDTSVAAGDVAVGSASKGDRGGSRTSVAATSANALRHAPKHLLERLKHLPCFAVGGETARQAQEAGFSRIWEGSGDADALAGAIIKEAPGMTVLYLCGRLRLSTFERQLSDAGIAVEPLETYDTVPVGYSSERLATIVGKMPIDAVLLYSVHAAQNFLKQAWPSATVVGNTRLLCISARVAERLADVEKSRILVAEEPTEDALLALI